jgi:putative ABC transport system ATP-binding protein
MNTIEILERTEMAKVTERPSGTEPLISLRNVVKTYVTSAVSFMALKNIDLSVNKGEFLAVVGKSGSGKSTLLNMLTGIDRPSAGEIVVGGTTLQSLSEGQASVWRGKNVGIVFQFFQLLPTLTVAENVMLAMDFCKTVPARERRPRALALLSQMGIAAQADKLPSTLSGGEQQRAAIARAMANDPPIIIADEPTGNLDTQTAADIFRLLQAQAAAGKTVIIVTHDRELASLAHRTVTIADGRIIGEE